MNMTFIHARTFDCSTTSFKVHYYLVCEYCKYQRICKTNHLFAKLYKM